MHVQARPPWEKLRLGKQHRPHSEMDTGHAITNGQVSQRAGTVARNNLLQSHRAGKAAILYLI